MRATSIALACSTLIRSGLAIAPGDSAGASTMVRAFGCSGLVMTVISSLLVSHYSAGTWLAATAWPSFLARYSL